MDKKSFLRGFGVGVLFAAVILGISFTVRTSDSYVTSKAKKLGMVFQNQSEAENKLVKATPDSSAKPAETPVPSKKTKSTKSTEAPKATASVTPKATVTPKVSAKKSNTSDKKKELEAEKKKMEKEIQNEMKSLTINAGDWSSDVSRKLEELGIVKSAKDFDKYLNDNGYSSSISAGTYKVSVNDTYNELARKITGR